MRKPIAMAILTVLLGRISLAGAAPQTIAQRSSGTVELATGWKMKIADAADADAAKIAEGGFDVETWYPVARMPATVLQVLEDNGVNKDLYFGMNLTLVPKDLWKHDWWYRTQVYVPPGHQAYSIIFNGINYRAEVWVNGQRIADSAHIVGMYRRFELDVTNYVRPGKDNVLAVKVTPEQRLTRPGFRELADSDKPADQKKTSARGVDLSDSWLDWINWKYLGIDEDWLSFVPDRNAGVWKKVYLSYGGKVAVRNSYVRSDLRLPALDSAALSVYADVHNFSSAPSSGLLTGEISRKGKPLIRLERKVALGANETKEISFLPADFPVLRVDKPDFWWPYQWGKPNLYDIKLDFKINGRISGSDSHSFGIRTITQHRDTDESSPDIGRGGNFYLKVNGKDYLVRGAAYTPDLLFKNDPERDRTIMRYAKDLGINLLRWELKIADDDMLALADREGMPVMQGLMCCTQWERWDLWDDDDHRVAHESMISLIDNLRPHASAFLWANGSDGLPPDEVLADYHQILRALHWQNAAVDTVSHGNKQWNGIHMAGPYSWRPPYFWFSEKSSAARGSSAEEGNNETIPPLESLKKFLPADKLWPINDYWYMHAGAVPGNNQLTNITLALDKRYGPSLNAAEYARKAQVAIYENVRAQFETYAASGWPSHKMMVYWMLNSPWPSFFGHLFDYYFKQGGGYFGAKKALQPLTAVFDSYATGDRSSANVYLVNQGTQPRGPLTVIATVYALDGTAKHIESAAGLNALPASSVRVLRLPRYADMSSTYFVRLQVRDTSRHLLAENVYWQSTTDDVMAAPVVDDPLVQMKLSQASWADYSALNSMPRVNVNVSARARILKGHSEVEIQLTNASDQIAFFVRAELLDKACGDEILPITYTDNYVTLFPHESLKLQASVSESQLRAKNPVVRIEGYNVSSKTEALKHFRARTVAVLNDRSAASTLRERGLAAPFR